MASAVRDAVVLIVEDEPLLMMAAIDLVEDAGFGAVHAADADEAVRILEKRTDITIVFTDIDMPGSMDGMKLAAAIRHRWPPIHIIMVSGHVTPSKAQMPEGSLFFPKPYSNRAVTAALQGFAA